METQGKIIGVLGITGLILTGLILGGLIRVSIFPFSGEVEGLSIDGEMQLLDSEGNPVHTFPLAFMYKGKEVNQANFDFKIIITPEGDVDPNSIEGQYLMYARLSGGSLTPVNAYGSFTDNIFQISGSEWESAYQECQQTLLEIVKYIDGTPSSGWKKDVYLQLEVAIRMKDKAGNWIDTEYTDSNHWLVVKNIFVIYDLEFIDGTPTGPASFTFRTAYFYEEKIR